MPTSHATDKSRIVHLHLSDAQERPPEEVLDNQRLMPGEGIVNLVGFLQALKKIGYQDGISPEPLGRIPKDMAAEDAARLGLETTQAVMKKAGGLDDVPRRSDGLLARFHLVAKPLLLFAQLRRELRAEIFGLEHRPDFHLGLLVVRVRASLQPLDGFVHRLDLPQPVAGDEFLGLGERAVDDGALACRRIARACPWKTGAGLRPRA